MRRLVVLLALLAAAGCGGGDGETITVTETVGVRVPLPPDLPAPLPESGTLPVDAFNAYTASVDERWERDLGALVGVFVDAGATDAAHRSFEATTRGEGSAATATLVLDGLFDDSVRARRYDVELRKLGNGAWELLSASWSQRCRAGRGHQDFSPEPCQ